MAEQMSPKNAADPRALRPSVSAIICYLTLPGNHDDHGHKSRNQTSDVVLPRPLGMQSLCDPRRKLGHEGGLSLGLIVDCRRSSALLS